MGSCRAGSARVFTVFARVGGAPGPLVGGLADRIHQPTDVHVDLCQIVAHVEQLFLEGAHFAHDEVGVSGVHVCEVLLQVLYLGIEDVHRCEGVDHPSF